MYRGYLNNDEHYFILRDNKLHSLYTNTRYVKGGSVPMFEKLPVKQNLKPSEYNAYSGYSLDWELLMNLTLTDEDFKRNWSRGTMPLTNAELHDFTKLYRLLSMRHRRLVSNEDFVSSSFLDHHTSLRGKNGLVQPHILFLSLLCGYSELPLSVLLNYCSFDYLLFSYDATTEQYGYQYGCKDFRNDRDVNMRVVIVNGNIYVPSETYEQISLVDYNRLNSEPRYDSVQNNTCDVFA